MVTKRSPRIRLPAKPSEPEPPPPSSAVHPRAEAERAGGLVDPRELMLETDAAERDLVEAWLAAERLAFVATHHELTPVTARLNDRLRAHVAAVLLGLRRVRELAAPSSRWVTRAGAAAKE